MTDVQGKKFINLTGLHLFWQNVIKPKFDVLAGAVDTLDARFANFGGQGISIEDRFNKFGGVEGTTIEEAIEAIRIQASAAGVTSMAAAEPADGALVKVGVSGVETQSGSGIYQGAITVSIDESELTEKFGIIEGAISGKASQGDLDAAVGRISTAEGKITAAEGKITTLEGTVNGKAAQGDLDAAVGRISTAEGKITTLENSISGEGGINSKIAGLESSKANQSDLDTANGKITTAEGKIATLEGAIVTKANQSDLDTANGKITTAEGKIATLESTIVNKANQSDLDTANGKIKTNADNITALQTAVEALSSATDFIGVTSTAISDGNKTNPVKINEQDYTATKGDIVIYGNKEFIWDGAKWVELGDTTALAQDVETLKTAAETNANTALLVSEVEAAFEAGWNPQPAQ